MSVSVHLVGSVGLESVNEVFESAGGMLGPHLQRIPDGEPGGRRLWISWQYPLLRANPFLQVDASVAQRASAGFPKLKLADGVGPDELQFGELGYAREARASYQDFTRARDRGALARDARFQVCLPTPLAVIDAFCAKDAVPLIEPAYEAAMRREVETITSEIPHRDLCIQWDVCVEMILWDGRSEFYSQVASKPSIVQRFHKLCCDIPGDVEVGFHLCYGDFEAKHFIEPVDAGAMVSFANEIAAHAGHAPAYFHLPVPIDRDDDAFFAPFQNLKLPPDCQLFLGLVHAADGVDGAARRASAARRVAPEFGVATECGLGRCKTPADVRHLLRLHAAIAKRLETETAA